MKTLLALIFFALAAPLFGQEMAELDRRGGFKDIKLMSDVESYADLEFKKNYKDGRYPGAKLYKRKKGTYGSVGILEVYDLEVKSYKGQIYEIVVVVQKSMGMYRGLVNAFGEPKHSHRTNKNYWHTKDIRLNYHINNKDRIVLEYYSLAMEEVRKKEQKERLQELVDDF